MSEPLAATPFHDLGEYLAIPRVTGLRLAPDGRWLAASVQTLSADGAKYVTSIWRIDAAGGPPARLTRSAEGEGSPRFLPDGSLVFISKRPDPDAGGAPGLAGGAAGGDGTASKGDKPALWLLPSGGGEARMIAALPGGVTAVETALAADAESGGVVVASPVLTAVSADAAEDGPGEDGGGSVAADARLRTRRSAAGVTAILHESGPVRYWDKDLGPDDTRLFAVNPSPRDLTPDAHHSFIEQTYTVSPDGAHVATGWYRWRGTAWNSELVVIEVATGKRTVLLSDPDADYHSPAFSPDGRSLACVRAAHDSEAGPGDITLVIAGIDADAPETIRADEGSRPAGGADTDGEARDLVPGFDRWPLDPVWEPGGRFVYFTADDHGRRPAFRADIRTGEVTRITGDDGAYADLAPSPDGRHLFALRAALDEPPAPVRIDLAAGEVARLASPAPALRLPGRLTEIHATADDGHPIRSWLVLPEPPPANGGGPAPTAAPAPPAAQGAPAAPLVLWVHGGPSTSWNGWHWRWNPWLMAAQGYAVLLPDPALSSGYGIDFIRRGYRQWGPRPFSDLMTATDGAVARPDIDGARTAMMGGSYGGYMANWIAGHTGRFRAIVSHAGLWALDQMFATTDLPMAWYPQFSGPELQARNSPHLHAASITTPMLVIHGDKDYRVPVGEALRLWWDLSRHGKTGQFLYFPDQGHWVMTPGNVRAWYETVFAFLARHVLGEPWRRPDLL